MRLSVRPSRSEPSDTFRAAPRRHFRVRDGARAVSVLRILV